MKRSRMNRRKSRRQFTRHAVKTHKLNSPRTIKRGGIRL